MKITQTSSNVRCPVGPSAVFLLLFPFASFLSGCGEPRADEFQEISGDAFQSSDESVQIADARRDTYAADTLREDLESNNSQRASDDSGSVESEVIEQTQVEPLRVEDKNSNADVSGSALPALEQATESLDVAENTPRSNAPKSAKPLKIHVLVTQREFKAEGPQGALRATYDDIDLLKVLNMDPVTLDAPKFMPEWLKGLDGKRILLRGFMYPPIQETGLKGFVLARDNQICCFGRNPKPYDIIEVTLREGVTVGYIQNRPFDVEGVFHIRPLELDGRVEMVYQIDDAIVID